MQLSRKPGTERWAQQQLNAAGCLMGAEKALVLGFAFGEVEGREALLGKQLFERQPLQDGTR